MLMKKPELNQILTALTNHYTWSHQNRAELVDLYRLHVDYIYSTFTDDGLRTIASDLPTWVCSVEGPEMLRPTAPWRVQLLFGPLTNAIDSYERLNGLLLVIMDIRDGQRFTNPNGLPPAFSPRGTNVLKVLVPSREVSDGVPF